jgi:hypothetical protein
VDCQPHRLTASAIFVVLAISAGCAGAPPPPTAGPTSAAPTSLECETQGFPCTFAGVSEQVRAETERLTAEATRRMADGATNDAVVTWLASESSVAEAEGDADAIRFRPVDGRGVWLTRRLEGASASVALASSATAHMGTWDHGLPPLDTNQSVTGPGLAARKALVLSPYRWDFGDTDDGQSSISKARLQADRSPSGPR